jgi:hypothetical protein
MSRTCRHISVTVQLKASLATPLSGRAGLPRVRLNRPVDTLESFETAS